MTNLNNVTMKRPEDILSQPYHIQEYINHLERYVVLYNVGNLLLCGECNEETEHEELSHTTVKCLECGNIAVE